MNEEFETDHERWIAKKGAMLKSVFPNAPRFVNCKICSSRFQNPIFEGSSIVIVCCDECRGVKKKAKVKAKAKARASTLQAAGFPFRTLGEIQ